MSVAARIRWLAEDIAGWMNAGKMLGRFEVEGVVLAYVSNGRMLVARPLSDWPVESHDLFPCSLGLETIPGLLRPTADPEWGGSVDASVGIQWSGDDAVWPHNQECDNCSGTGECRSCDCGQEHDCGSCDGKGEAMSDPPFVAAGVGPHAVQRHYIGQCLQLMEASGVVSLSWRGDQLLMASGEARAIIMRLVQPARLHLPVEAAQP